MHIWSKYVSLLLACQVLGGCAWDQAHGFTRVTIMSWRCLFIWCSSGYKTKHTQIRVWIVRNGSTGQGYAKDRHVDWYHPNQRTSHVWVASLICNLYFNGLNRRIVGGIPWANDYHTSSILVQYWYVVYAPSFMQTLIINRICRYHTYGLLRDLTFGDPIALLECSGDVHAMHRLSQSIEQLLIVCRTA